MDHFLQGLLASECSVRLPSKSMKNGAIQSELSKSISFANWFWHDSLNLTSLLTSFYEMSFYETYCLLGLFYIRIGLIYIRIKYYYYNSLMFMNIQCRIQGFTKYPFTSTLLHAWNLPSKAPGSYWSKSCLFIFFFIHTQMSWYN